MRAVSRLGWLLLGGALAIAPSTALAQEAPPPSDTPAADSVGPRELQNFSLNGTVTHAADQPAPVQASPPARKPRPQPQAAPAATAPAPAVEASNAAPNPTPRRTESASAALPRASQPQGAPDAAQQSAPAPSVTVPLPGLKGSQTANGAAAPAASASFAPDPAPVGTLAPEHRFPILPWLLAALALCLGGGFLFWRNRTREAFAGGPRVDAFVAPVPAAAPRRAPTPAPPPASKPSAPTAASLGVVSTRIRPWLDIGFHPLRCVLDEERVTIELELELFNSGSAPARAVLAEASLFNAGPSQDQEIGAFFASPVGEGERILAIPPLKRIAMKTQVAVPRSQIQAYELGGRQVFVPLIAFNALYSWSGGHGQTSASYLLGRDTNGEKMGPFRLDLGPRIFRGIAARLLPAAVRN